MKKSLKIIVFIGLIFSIQLATPHSCQAQVKWHTIEDAAKTKIGSKLYFIDFYTSWCGYCKKMDRETFSDPTVAKILNRYYYPVKFDAEGSSTFNWFGRTFRPASSGRNRIHQFAQGVQGFPTFAICSADGKAIQNIPGFVPAKDFTIILWYIASGDYNRYSYEQYQKIFDKDIRPSMEKALKP
jgi:thioredoxin-related protein